MLGFCRTHKDYQTFVLTELKVLSLYRPDQIEEYQVAVAKMFILNLDPLIPIITPLYSDVGRPASMQVDIFRSLVLMNHLQIPLNNWVAKLKCNPVLRAAAGFTLDNLPETSSYYDFIDRIFPLDGRPVLRHVASKPKDKLKKGDKLPPRNPNVVAKLVDQLINSDKKFYRRISRRPERFLQRIFASVSVGKSIDLGLIPRSPNVSGDGATEGFICEF